MLTVENDKCTYELLNSVITFLQSLLDYIVDTRYGYCIIIMLF